MKINSLVVGSLCIASIFLVDNARASTDSNVDISRDVFINHLILGQWQPRAFHSSNLNEIPDTTASLNVFLKTILGKNVRVTPQSTSSSFSQNTNPNLFTQQFGSMKNYD